MQATDINLRGQGIAQGVSNSKAMNISLVYMPDIYNLYE